MSADIIRFPLTENTPIQEGDVSNDTDFRDGHAVADNSSRKITDLLKVKEAREYEKIEEFRSRSEIKHLRYGLTASLLEHNYKKEKFDLHDLATRVAQVDITTIGKTLIDPDKEKSDPDMASLQNYIDYLREYIEADDLNGNSNYMDLIDHELGDITDDTFERIEFDGREIDVFINYEEEDETYPYVHKYIVLSKDSPLYGQIQTQDNTSKDIIGGKADDLVSNTEDFVKDAKNYEKLDIDESIPCVTDGTLTEATLCYSHEYIRVINLRFDRASLGFDIDNTYAVPRLTLYAAVLAKKESKGELAPDFIDAVLKIINVAEQKSAADSVGQLYI